MDKEAVLTEYLKGFMTEQRIERIEEILSNRTRHLTVVLENIYHPFNASSIIRNCECFGLQDLHIMDTGTPYRPNADVARGAKNWIQIQRHNAAAECINSLKDMGYAIASTCLTTDAITPEELPLDRKIALVFGTEETGVSCNMSDISDYSIKIPMHGFTQSLNVSVSVALCLKILTDRLQNSKIDWHLSGEEKAELRLDWYKKSVRKPEQLIKHFTSKE